jgi:hypothetical protein
MISSSAQHVRLGCQLYCKAFCLSVLRSAGARQLAHDSGAAGAGVLVGPTQGGGPPSKDPSAPTPNGLQPRAPGRRSRRVRSRPRRHLRGLAGGGVRGTGAATFSHRCLGVGREKEPRDQAQPKLLTRRGPDRGVRAKVPAET